MWLHFRGVNNAFYCWLNGTMLGYSQDSCCPAEFEVTALLKPGQNMLAVQVCPPTQKRIHMYLHTCTCIHMLPRGLLLAPREPNLPPAPPRQGWHRSGVQLQVLTT